MKRKLREKKKRKLQFPLTVFILKLFRYADSSRIYGLCMQAGELNLLGLLLLFLSYTRYPFLPTEDLSSDVIIVKCCVVAIWTILVFPESAWSLFFHSLKLSFFLRNIPFWCSDSNREVWTAWADMWETDCLAITPQFSEKFQVKHM